MKIYDLKVTGTWNMIAESQERAREILERLLPPRDAIVGFYVARKAIQISVEGEKELKELKE